MDSYPAYASDLTDVPEVDSATHSSFACPEVWEGRLTDGRYFYFRYRHGVASLALSRLSVDDAAVQPRKQMDHGDSLRGIFEYSSDRELVFRRLLTEWDL